MNDVSGFSTEEGTVTDINSIGKFKKKSNLKFMFQNFNSNGLLRVKKTKISKMLLFPYYKTSMNL